MDLGMDRRQSPGWRNDSEIPQASHILFISSGEIPWAGSPSCRFRYSKWAAASAYQHIAGLQHADRRSVISADAARQPRGPQRFGRRIAISFVRVRNGIVPIASGNVRIVRLPPQQPSIQLNHVLIRSLMTQVGEKTRLCVNHGVKGMLTPSHMIVVDSQVGVELARWREARLALQRGGLSIRMDLQ
jgi:hypothetical protein